MADIDPLNEKIALCLSEFSIPLTFNEFVKSATESEFLDDHSFFSEWKKSHSDYKIKLEKILQDIQDFEEKIGMRFLSLEINKERIAEVLESCDNEPANAVEYESRFSHPKS